GGVLTAAVAIGRLVRERKLETIVREKAICSSGCALVWFAGIRRRLDGRLGLHSAAEGQSAVASEAGESQMAAYMREMGLSELMARLPATVEPSDMHWFDAVGLAEWGVVVEPPQVVAKKRVHQFPPAAQAEVDRQDLERLSRWTAEDWAVW